jgi:hypothetical protein
MADETISGRFLSGLWPRITGTLGLIVNAAVWLGRHASHIIVPLILLFLITMFSYVLLLTWPVTHTEGKIICSEWITQEPADGAADQSAQDNQAAARFNSEPLRPAAIIIRSAVGQLLSYCSTDAELNSITPTPDKNASATLVSRSAATQPSSMNAGTLEIDDSIDAVTQSENAPQAAVTENGATGHPLPPPASRAEPGPADPAPTEEIPPDRDTKLLEAEEQAETQTGRDKVRQGNALFLAVLAAGIIGGCVYSLREHTRDIAQNRYRNETWQWNLARPFIGGALAILMFFVVRAGFIQDGNNSALKPEGFIAIAAMVGLFTDQAWAKLKQVAESIFAKPENNDDGAPVAISDTSR